MVPKTWRIAIQNGKFEQVEIFANDSVFWVNEDTDKTHLPGTNVPPQGPIPWTANKLAPNDTSETLGGFTIAKTYSYMCLMHPGEKGAIVVMVSFSISTEIAKALIIALTQALEGGGSKKSGITS